MEYFTLFEIPVALKLNTSLLSKKYFALSRKYHPDFHANETDLIQDEVLQKSAIINKAWKTFQNQEAIIKYVLMEKGLLTEEEKYNLSPDFLMEVMDLNELLMDLDESVDKTGILNNLNSMQQEIYTPVEKIIDGYNDEVTTKADLLLVKDYYYKKKYLDRMSRELVEKL